MIASVRNIPAKNGGNLDKRIKKATPNRIESIYHQNLFSSFGSKSKALSSKIKSATPRM
jgi:hypothetical protein|tara:strand:+ start:634 stop:810 length:177 start_codon:yes stop_codon:yes gene_type:complete